MEDGFQFRTAAFGGFQKQDVMDYLERSAKEHAQKVAAIQTELEEEKVVITMSVLMTYGHTIPEVGKAVQEAVKTAIESMTGLEVSAVNVSVTGIVFPPKE